MRGLNDVRRSGSGREEMEGERPAGFGGVS